MIGAAGTLDLTQAADRIALQQAIAIAPQQFAQRGHVPPIRLPFPAVIGLDQIHLVAAAIVQYANQPMFAVGGLGNAVTDLRYVQWLSDVPLWYWGDIDTEGFSILSGFRVMFRQLRSLLMDEETMRTWRDRIGTVGTGRGEERLSNLTWPEEAAFQVCLRDNLRIEQEHFPQTFVVETLRATIG